MFGYFRNILYLCIVNPSMDETSERGGPTDKFALII